MTETRHPDVHTPWKAWSEEQTLHVAVAYSNPVRWTTRRMLLNDFRQHMRASANVVLHTGELAYGDRPFEVTGGDPNDVQLRTSHELWHKENILNIVVQRFPPGWRYGAVIDGDFHMTRRDWALEAIHQLQHYDFVQLFSSYSDLSAAHGPFRIMASFAYNYVNRASNSEYRSMLRAAAAAPYGYYGMQPKAAQGKPAPWGGWEQPGAPGLSAVPPSTRWAGCWTPASWGRPTGTCRSGWWGRSIPPRNCGGAARATWNQ